MYGGIGTVFISNPIRLTDGKKGDPWCFILKMSFSLRAECYASKKKLAHSIRIRAFLDTFFHVISSYISRLWIQFAAETVDEFSSDHPVSKNDIYF